MSRLEREAGPRVSAGIVLPRGEQRLKCCDVSADDYTAHHSFTVSSELMLSHHIHILSEPVLLISLCNNVLFKIYTYSLIVFCTFILNPRRGVN